MPQHIVYWKTANENLSCMSVSNANIQDRPRSGTGAEDHSQCLDLLVSAKASDDKFKYMLYS